MSQRNIPIDLILQSVKPPALELMHDLVELLMREEPLDAFLHTNHLCMISGVLREVGQHLGPRHLNHAALLQQLQVGDVRLVIMVGEDEVEARRGRA